MIICLIGGIGEGKTLSVIREIIKNSQPCYTNFDVKIPDCYRLKLSDIIIKSDKLKDWGVNWQFWEDARKKNRNFSIYLDEIHNIIHARGSMTKRNQLMSVWVSQIRKILSDSATSHLYIISQTISKIDKDFRDLTHVFIRCKKVEHEGNVYIIQRWFSSVEALEFNTPFAKSVFSGNEYFRYYDYNRIVKFTDAEEYV